MPKFKVGDRVRDAYKRPKPGDENTTGKIVDLTGAFAKVEWDAPDSLGRTVTEIRVELLKPELRKVE